MVFKILHCMTSEDASPNAGEFMVRTRDGVDLATDVYVPGGDQPQGYSAVLSRTPYDKSSRYTGLKYEAEYFMSRGYVFVAQDVRGKFRSTGATDPYTFEVDDAYDTVDWIVKQPWSNGRVAAVGASYYGFAAWATVASGHPAVKAAVPQVTGIDMGHSHVSSVWHQDPPSLCGLSDLLQIWSNNNGYLAEFDWSCLPSEIVAAAAKTIGESCAASKLLAHSQDQVWYNPYGGRHPYHTTNVPILHWQNWYDPGLAPSGMKDWRHFRQLSSTRGLHYLRVGSADHSGFKLEHVGSGDENNPYSNDSTMQEKTQTECSEMADFFDEHVNGIKPSKPRPRARWHIGHLGWQESAEFPPPSQPVTFRLSADSEESFHKLCLEHTQSSTSLTWIHDPTNPVPSTTSIEAIWYLLAAYPDEREQAKRADVLTFRTAALVDDFIFAGQPILNARISYAADSSHLFATLQDVYPDGTTRPISWSQTVLTKHAGPDVRISMADNAYRVQAGHCLQLQLQSSNWPYYAVHPGTDESPWTATTKVPVENSIELGGLEGATLVLPKITITGADGEK